MSTVVIEGTCVGCGRSFPEVTCCCDYQTEDFMTADGQEGIRHHDGYCRGCCTCPTNERRKLTERPMQPCPDCGGAGFCENTGGDHYTCRACHGNKLVVVTPELESVSS
jgi:DnaJ-class molecular chaperone